MAQRRSADAGLSARRRIALMRLAALAGVSASGLAACAGPAQPPLPTQAVDGGPFRLPMAPPRPQLGERWLYRAVNRYNGSVSGTVTLECRSVAPLQLSRRFQSAAASAAGTVAEPAGARLMRFESAWHVLVDASFDDEYHFSPAVALLPPRLEPGASSWTRHRFSVPGNSGQYGWQQRLMATGAEVVETPAGRFDTLVIRREIWFDSPEPFRFSRQREETRWYAPAVNGFVRRTWTGSYLEEASIDLPERRREDWITEELTAYEAGGDPKPVG